MKAFLLTIGDELLIGQVIDTNTAWLGQKLNDIGVDVVERMAVGDDLPSIIDGLRHGVSKADLVLITGGLGPTKDDITKHALAEFLHTKLVFSEETYDKIKSFFESLNRSISESHRIQCFLPESAILLKNRMGTAPGMLFYHEDKTIISMPGVPYEMQAIMSDVVIPMLLEKSDASAIYHKTLMTAGKGETDLEDVITPLVDQFPPNIKIAYLPSLANVRLRVTGKGDNLSLVKSEVDHWSNEIEKTLGSLVYGYDNISLEETVKNIFIDRKLTLSTAESCTGGYIAHRVTSVPGSSAYFEGSIVSYSNKIKQQLLHVKKDTLNHQGAVSEDTVREMVAGALAILNTEVALSVSGIAGPDGGTIDKPVGTIWIAVGNKDKIVTFKIKGSKDRAKNIEYAANIALNKLRLFVLENY